MNKTVRLILQDCESNDPEKQFQAILQVEDLNLIEAIPTLTKLLSSSDTHVRSAAISALTSLGADQAESIAPIFVEQLNDPDELIRCDLLDSLAQFKYEPAMEEVIVLLHSDPSYLVRASAAETLEDIAEVKNPNALKALKQSLKNDSHESVRTYSASALGVLGGSEELDTIEEYIKEEDSIKVRAKLFAAGCRLGNKSLVENLLSILKEEDEEIVFFAINTIKYLIEELPPQSFDSHAALIRDELLRVQKNIHL